jgi:hypothetical protein
LNVCHTCERIIPESASACPHCSGVKAPVGDVRPSTPGEAATGGLGRRELMLIGAAVIGSGFITLAVMGARGSMTATAAPVDRAPAAAASRPSDGPASTTPGWTENRALWTGNDRKSVALELAARNETQVWMKSVRPMLVVRCIGNRSDVFVFTDSAAAMEAQDEAHTVRVGFDQEADRTERWPDSVGHDALFAPDGAAFARQLSRAQTLRFGYTPHNAAPVVAHFDVAGLADKIGLDAAPCASTKSPGRAFDSGPANPEPGWTVIRIDHYVDPQETLRLQAPGPARPCLRRMRHAGRRTQGMVQHLPHPAGDGGQAKIIQKQ